jgi:predicted TIM-barrel fold metal-dependent hydrolase
MDSSGSNSWMRYLPYDLDLRKIFERAITTGGAEKVIFGTDSTFFPRGFRINILEQQYEAVRSLSEGSDAIVSVEDIDAIFRGNILRLNGFTPKNL